MKEQQDLAQPEAKINDFVARFANVNGTGSASANFLFAKAIFRMGIPVTPKNIFPSNIQGLPTWYEVRVSEKGYLGRREGIDLLVAVNAQSMKQDIESVKPGGYLMYDSTKKLHADMIRGDIHYLGIPMMEMANENFTNPRQRQLFKNIIYVGALSILLNIEFEVLQTLLKEQFAGKEKLIAPNVKALKLGMDYAAGNFDYPLDFHLERRNLIRDKILVDGNTACGLGAVYGGATVMAWYPITPSTSVAEAFEKFAAKYRTDPETGKKNYAVIQAEDELAAMGMVIGANWNGARSLTATSGPGVSLMNEFIGLAYFAEVPAVLIDVQRAGPSTGMPTRTQQSDITIAAYASHGDSKHPLLFPSTPKECFEMTAISFDLADRLQTPIILMTDLDLGMNDHLSEPFQWDAEKTYDRGKVFNKEELEAMGRYGRYLDNEGDGIPYRTYPGTHPSKGAFTTRGTSRDEYAVYTESSEAYVRNMNRLMTKWETAKKIMPEPRLYQKENQQEVGMLFFGTSTYSSEEAKDLLGAKGIHLDAIRIKSFPFGEATEAFIQSHKLVFIIEQNRDGQLRSLIINEMQTNPAKLIPVLNYDGMPITADEITSQISNYLKQKNAVSHDLSETHI
jgi:2-oxoglutarate ferredoxin oxidoreductase subunit alpha